jgi:hypothetical protein
VDADTFARKWTPKRVSELLGRYGLSITRTMRRREYRLAIDPFKAIERNYGFDLNTDGEERFHVRLASSL